MLRVYEVEKANNHKSIGSQGNKSDNTSGIPILKCALHIGLMVIPFLIVHLLVQGLMMKRTLDAVHED
ncbi:MAG: hypothetical protein AAFV93_20990, partial [Chloroflexota bacterium]